MLQGREGKAMQIGQFDTGRGEQWRWRERSTEEWIDCYRRVRKQTEVLCRPLQEEDFNLQAMAEVSPPKWHLAHTTWFFEALLLNEFCSGYSVYHPRYGELFNSYYRALGTPLARDRRGLLSRPTLREVCAYRHGIDEQ